MDGPRAYRLGLAILVDILPTACIRSYAEIVVEHLLVTHLLDVQPALRILHVTICVVEPQLVLLESEVADIVARPHSAVVRIEVLPFIVGLHPCGRPSSSPADWLDHCAEKIPEGVVQGHLCAIRALFLQVLTPCVEHLLQEGIPGLRGRCHSLTCSLQRPLPDVLHPLLLRDCPAVDNGDRCTYERFFLVHSHLHRCGEFRRLRLPLGYRCAESDVGQLRLLLRSE